MANLTSGQFEKFKALKMKPEVAQNKKKKNFSGSPGKKKIFSQSHVKNFFYFLFFGWSFYSGPALTQNHNLGKPR